MRFFKNATAYGDTINSYDALKLIALATMIIDHIGAYLYPDVEFLRVIGRMAFPLFLFLVGYSGNWAVRADLMWSAAMVAVCAVATNHPVLPLNILITIAVVRFVMSKLVKRELTPSYLSAVFIVSVVWYPLFLWLDYSTLAGLFAFCGYLRRYRPESRETTVFIAASVLFHFLLQYNPQYSGFDVVVMGVIGLCVLCIIQRFSLHKVAAGAGLPVWPRLALQWAARNTLPLYVLHLVLLMVAERLFFPGRVLHFSWF